VPPLAAALHRLTTEPDLRARMGQAGRARAVTLYDEAAIVAHSLDILRL
jgi:glycosyltransferase involved in cell wall biosynthesis